MSTTDNKGYHRNETAAPDRYVILKCFAKENRNNMTEAERRLWYYLKDRSRGKVFRRQHAILDYIVDFICLKDKLIIEIDGGYHDVSQQVEEDRIRQKRLQDIGYKVLRFKNEEVYNDLNKVLNTIYNSKTY